MDDVSRAERSIDGVPTSLTELLRANRANWDERAPAHAGSPEYELAAFERDPAHLSGVVRFDLARLGDVAGLRGVHLQCHIGTDTVSLARLGANMTGLDFSPAALSIARDLARRAGVDVDFVESDVQAALEVLEPHSFDLVYTGIGALCWLPSIERWADVVAGLLAPGGRLFIREGHPVLFSLAEAREDGLLVVAHPYFELDQPVRWDFEGTYVTTDAVFATSVTYEWNHGLGQIVTALVSRGLRLVRLDEHDSVPWEALHGQMVCDDMGEWRLAEGTWRVPLSYTLVAERPGA